MSAGGVDTGGRLRETFRDPGVEYRSSPFWAWNGKLDGAELVRQAAQMKAQGMGGFFMHSREGLETPYMGEEWMDRIAEVVDAARGLGLRAWLYDEDRFPSGGAGGRVAAMGEGDDFRAKAVTLELRGAGGPPPSVDEEVLALFLATLAADDGNRLLALRRWREGDPAGAAEDVWLLLRREVSGGSEWFNGEAPVDNLNPEAVRAFISVTHDPYWERFGGDFGSVIPGIFTDEPSIADFHCRYAADRPWLPWSDGFAERFREQRGYDLIERLPYLFFDGALSAKTRHDYWRTIAYLFENAYSRQLGEWCGQQGLSFTGHYLIEHNLGISVRVSGAVMPHYRHQQLPGIDILDEKTEEWLTVKQCTSVARQFGRKHVLSEMYGCCGWDFTFEGQKWLGDWQFVLGVTLRCQHLALYSLSGCRKRDFPPVFSEVSPWWKYNYAMENYFSRLSAVLSDGEPVRDLLVLHPATTAWTIVGCDPRHYWQWEDPTLLAVNEYEAGLVRTMKTLLGRHLDFDFGDETIMADDGAVRDGKLRVGPSGAYRAVLLPNLRSVLRSTYELLRKFADAGGLIVAVGGLPTMLDGEEAAAEWGELARHPRFRTVADAGEAVMLLERDGHRSVSIRGEHGLELPQLLYMFRKHEDGWTLFVVNNDRLAGVEAEVRLPVLGTLEEWNPLTGDVTLVPSTEVNGGLRFVARWGAAGSKLYRIVRVNESAANRMQPGKRKPDFTYRMAHESDMAALTLPVNCAFSRTLPNALLLDRCEYRMYGESWSAPMQVWEAQKEVRERLGMRAIHYNGQQQRFRWAVEPHERDGATVDWRFSYEIAEAPLTELHVVIEHAAKFRVTLDGEDVPVASRDAGFFLDREWRRIRLPHHGPGRHELTLSCRYCNADEMEDIILVGDFAVGADRAIMREPLTLSVGDWTLQGYPHYPGNIVYHYELAPGALRRATGGLSGKLTLGQWRGACVEVRVDGESAGIVGWEEADGVRIPVLPEERDEPLRIDVEVAGSLRNLLGPFHQSGQHNPWMDWSFFEREGARSEPGYRLKPYGLMTQPSLCPADQITHA